MLLRFALIVIMLLATPSLANAQPIAGCGDAVADRMDNTAKTMRSFLQIVEFTTPDAATYDGELKLEMSLLAEQHETMVQDLAKLITATEDAAYQVRLCARK